MSEIKDRIATIAWAAKAVPCALVAVGISYCLLPDPERSISLVAGLILGAVLYVVGARFNFPVRKPWVTIGLACGSLVAATIATWLWTNGLPTFSVSGTLMFLKNNWRDYLAGWSNWSFNRYWLWPLPLGMLYLVFLWGKRQFTIRHSNVKPHQRNFNFSTAVVISGILLGAATVNVGVATMGPTVPETTVQRVVKIRNVCKLIDNSGSMEAVLEEGAKELREAAAKVAPGKNVDGGNNRTLIFEDEKLKPDEKYTRSHGAQDAARFMIGSRMTNDPNNTDRYCLLRFDDDLYMMAPLTNDKRAIMLRTRQITQNVGGGTNFVVGLQKAYDYMTNPSVTGENSTRVVIMITDGFDAIEPEKRKQFAQMYKKARIKFYVIGLGDGWVQSATKNKLDLDKFAEELAAIDPGSGIVFRANNPGSMRKAMEAIDKLEKAEEVVETQVLNREVDQAFILVGLLLFLLFLLGCAITKRIP